MLHQCIFHLMQRKERNLGTTAVITTWSLDVCMALCIRCEASFRIISFFCSGEHFLHGYVRHKVIGCDTFLYILIKCSCTCVAVTPTVYRIATVTFSFLNHLSSSKTEQQQLVSPIQNPNHYICLSIIRIVQSLGSTLVHASCFLLS